MKIKKEKIILIIFAISFLLPAANVRAADDIQVSTQNINISLSPAPDGHFIYEVGEKEISYFRNLGLQQITNNTLKYKASIQITFSVNIFTDYDALQSLPHQTYERSTRWLFITWDDDWSLPGGRYSKSYYVHYDDYVLKYHTLPWIDKDFTASISVRTADQIYLNDTSIDAPRFIVMDAIAGSKHVTKLDKYSDKFSGTQEVGLDSIDFREDSFDAKSFDDAEDDINGKLTTLDLGVSVYDTYNVTTQQKYVFGPSTGSNLKVDDNKIIFHVKNRPEIIVYKQIIRTRYAKMDVDTKDGPIFYDAGIGYCSPVTQTDVKRTIGWRINNFNFHQNYTARGALYLDVPFSSNKQKDMILRDPELVKGDIFWDTFFTGDTGASIIFTEQNNPLDDIFNFITSAIGKILLIVMLAMAVYISVKFFPQIAHAIGRRIN